MPYSITNYRSDIARKDAIVIPTYTDLRKHPGLSEDVFKKAGALRLSMACRKGKGLDLGEAYVTDGFKSRYKHIIHLACISDAANDPVTDEVIRKSYISALNAAKDMDLQTLFIPLLKRSNEKNIPEVYQIAHSTIMEFLRENDIDVELYVDDYRELVSTNGLNEIEKYIRENWKEPPKPQIRFSKQKTYSSPEEKQRAMEEIEERIRKTKESFSDYLTKLIDSRNLSNPEVYSRANISRQQFSRIISKEGYAPEKKTIYAFAIALELSEKETETLLKKAGHAFSETNKTDVIVQYFLEKQKYDMFEVNNVLLYYGESLLGSGM